MRTGVRLYGLMFIVVYLIWAVWLSHYPFQLSSDDALNFSRAVERFSVLEFRPHFPGYPAFVVFSRIAAFWGNAEVANVMVSFVSVLLIPLAASVIIFSVTSSLFATALTGLLIIMQPLMASLALNGLSDSLGILFLLLALMSGLKDRYYLSGLFLGLMLASRPSYFPLLAGFLTVPLLIVPQGNKLKSLMQGASSIMLVGAISFGYIWIYDGAAYIEEGIRFTSGHFGIWGNTYASDAPLALQWFDSLSAVYGISGLMIIALALLMAAKNALGVNRGECKQQTVIALVLSGYLIWLLLAQNPDNLRHWAPVMVLFSILISLEFHRFSQNSRSRLIAGVSGVGVLLCFAVSGLKNTHFLLMQAPVQQAISWLKEHPEAEVVGTNYSVNLLRNELEGRAVYDMYYPSSSLALGKSSKGGWRITGTRLKDHKLITQFPARFSGERRLYLYKISRLQTGS
ncbi:hypothetical protein [Vibrio sp. SCSIO 43137]|uniref:hypothetical protein n=1 Tax=Vibrio sp. SCSIO 43137 TaxID=3021011 RepID=UPI0023073FCD|nr:hypothetical protein [Vibrio sp. SCSIO 43137]WCE32502.1 hypothetical protein PK654_18600 [Vibrio sp. SCSIO 43137]